VNSRPEGWLHRGGFAVDKAARVTSAASGGQIVVSSVVRELVGFDPSYRFGEPFPR
jgi:class 3 adenylate cyclase